MAKRKRAGSWPPKGSYPLPTGGYIYAPAPVKGQRVRIIGHLKAEPDIKLALAVVLLAKKFAAEERRKESHLGRAPSEPQQ